MGQRRYKKNNKIILFFTYISISLLMGCNSKNSEIEKIVKDRLDAEYNTRINIYKTEHLKDDIYKLTGNIEGKEVEILFYEETSDIIDNYYGD